MKKIFISYRRSDLYNAEKIAKALRWEFGDKNVFFDIDSIQGGVEWPASIKSHLQQSDLMLLLIGPNWLHVQDERSGRRRIDEEGDWIRLEITNFLTRRKSNPQLVFLPVLVHGAKMPEKEFLDDQLGAICDHHYIELHNIGKSFLDQIVNLLIERYNFRSVNPDPAITPVKLPPPNPLTDKQEEDFLAEYPSWSIRSQPKSGSGGGYMRELYRFYDFQTYDEAWKFMCKVDEHGIRVFNHHPRWQNTYNRVEFWLCTFNIGHKPSQRDLDLAIFLEKTYREFT